MNTSTTNSVSVFSKSSQATKNSPTSQPVQPLSSLNFNTSPDSKLFNGWFSNNTTNFCR